MTALAAALLVSAACVHTQSQPPGAVIFEEVRIFNGLAVALSKPSHVLTVGGGLASPHSPLDESTFTTDQLRAAVQAATNWGTCVGLHACPSEAVQRAVAAGVKVIEHGHLIAEKGLWPCFQPFPDDGLSLLMPAPSMARLRELFSGTERTVNLAMATSRGAGGGKMLQLSGRRSPSLASWAWWKNARWPT